MANEEDDHLFEMVAGKDWSTHVGQSVVVMMSWGSEPAVLVAVTSLDGYPAARVRLEGWPNMEAAVVSLARLSLPARPSPPTGP